MVSLSFFFPTYDEDEFLKMILGVFVYLFIWVCNSQGKNLILPICC
jgi:hypothetical protein